MAFRIHPSVGLLALLLAGACASLDQPELVRPGTPVGAIEIQNRAEYPIADLRIGICGQTFGAGPDYGFDRLDGRRIAPGASLSFPASPGCYNVAVMTSSGGLLGSGLESFHTTIVSEDAQTPATVTVQPQ